MGNHPFLTLFSGVRFDFLDPKPEQILLEDIARNLSNTSRYNGGTSFFYSTAQHSIIMSYIAEDDYGLEIARAALLHDAGEAYVGEIVKPVKETLIGFHTVENRVTRTIFEKYGVNPDLWNCHEIKQLDDLMVSIEFRDLRPNCKLREDYPEPNPDILIARMGPEASYKRFLARFARLFPEHAEHAENLMQAGM